MEHSQIDSLPNKLPSIKESVLKRRKRREIQRVARVQLSIKKRQQQYKKSKQTFKRVEQFVKEYKLKERDLIRIKRQAKTRGNYYSIPEDRLGFVIRIRGTSQVSPKVRKILTLLKLKHINTGIFLKINTGVLNMLRICEPYVTWGYPNLSSVRELIYKRGYVKVDQKRLPITSNAIIEEKLGTHGLICTEDLIHEIFTIGEKFKVANNFLCTFKLNTPNGGWLKKTNHFNDGGEYGNRENKINKLIKRMI